MDAIAWIALFLLVLLGAPWAIALWLLWQASPARGRWAALDGPGRLLAVAVAALPEHRGEWARAMTAELDHLQDRAQRWWFALAGLRVALLPPRANRRLTLGAAAAAVIAWILLAGLPCGIIGAALGTGPAGVVRDGRRSRTRGAAWWGG